MRNKVSSAYANSIDIKLNWKKKMLGRSEWQTRAASPALPDDVPALTSSTSVTGKKRVLIAPTGEVRREAIHAENFIVSTS